MNFRIPFDRVNWITSSFLFGTALIALIGAPWYIYNYGLDWFQVVMFTFYFFATGMSITLGYHRLFAHKAFKAKKPVKLFTLIFGACAFENSALEWCRDHRMHHKHVDHDDDPYDISKGFFWAHIGWLLFKLRPEPGHDNVSDLRKDKMIMFQDRMVHGIAVIFGFMLPAALGYLWNGGAGALGGFLLSGVTRVVAVQHSTFFINSLCHTVGSRPFSTSNSARDSWVMALFTFGEGYHNYHHAFQHDYRNGVRKLTYDPTKWAIWAMSKVGLTSDLRRVPADKILLAEMAEARKKAQEQLKEREERLAAGELTAYEKALELLNELHAKHAQSYQELEEAVAERVEVSRKTLNRWRRETQELVEHMAYVYRMEAAVA